LNRRAFLNRFGVGLGGIALADMMSAASAGEGGLPGLPHFPPKAKRVIFLLMSGGPSQLESFDYKPELNRLMGHDLPESYRGGKDKSLPGMAGNQSHFPLVGSPFKFSQHGRSGAWVSELFPETAKVADDLCFIKSMVSEAVNHDPALALMQTGSPVSGRPSIGAWVSYGLGTDNRALPPFIVLVTRKPVDQPLSYRLWDSAFLPSRHQGVQFRSGHDPVLYLNEPAGVSRAMTRRNLDLLKTLHTHEREILPDAEIEARIEQYEMAFRMQSSVPDALDISHEPESVFDLYGPDARQPGSFASNCILARRLAEKNVKFIQLYHPGWDHHGKLVEGFKSIVPEIDRPCAALIQDLKQRDMLKDTLVVWGGEFGRTSYAQTVDPAKSGGLYYGRDHHRECFTFWMAGGGVRPGMSYGASCDLGYNVAKDPVTINDFHATMLHLLGIDHERLTYRFQGRDFRLTDVAGKVVRGILA
jgi:hypothetical protein